MINITRLINLFLELSSTDNSSLKEADLCGKVKKKLSDLNIACQEDDTARKIGGNCGNLYAFLDGGKKSTPILFSAHMDSVEPASGKKPKAHADGRISSDGTTVLGADDISGICAIIEALTSVLESGMEHRPVEILFDVAEETYCEGIQKFDFSRLISKEAYVFDLSGPVGTAANQAPSIISFCMNFHGRSAHAAFSPEDGIHAIKAAAETIVSIPCGRVENTTVNIGTISGGRADNVVPDDCTVTGEVRSFDDHSANEQLAAIRQIAEQVAGKVHASMTFQTERLCNAYYVSPNEPVATRFQNACALLGLEGRIQATYGGSDNNHFFHHGIRGIVVASGMNNCHSNEEYTSVSELEKAARLAEALILSKE